MHFVKKILSIEPYNLTLQFDDGSVRKLNLEEKIRQWSRTENSIYKFLLDKDNFLKVELNNELATIQWSNGIDFCPDMLYEWSK